nr:hypothetical protein Iba_chr10aCG7010 [Ipomoea batatas]
MQSIVTLPELRPPSLANEAKGDKTLKVLLLLLLPPQLSLPPQPSSARLNDAFSSNPFASASSSVMSFRGEGHVNGSGDEGFSKAAHTSCLCFSAIIELPMNSGELKHTGVLINHGLNCFKLPILDGCEEPMLMGFSAAQSLPHRRRSQHLGGSTCGDDLLTRHPAGRRELAAMG